MKIIKCILSMFLCVSLLLSSIPSSVLAITTNNSESVQNSIKAGTLNVGDSFYYGYYPQTQITDTVLIEQLNSLDVELIDYGYTRGGGSPSKVDMWYGDVIHDGEKYRKIYFEEYRASYSNDSGIIVRQDKNGFYINTTYWFKWESIEWMVLNKTTESLLVTTKNIIDAQPFNKTKRYTSWGQSTVRNWLNTDFLDFSFTETQKNHIITTENITNNESFNEVTNEKVFFLSTDNVLSEDWGFSTDEFEEDTSRMIEGTDYAKSQGLYVPQNYYESTEKSPFSPWWLRTYEYGTITVSYVDEDGQVWKNNQYCGPSENDYVGGIRPALNLNLNADISDITPPYYDELPASIQFGADRLSFGVDITGCVGDVIDSLLVYTSANENIASLDITSSNTDIVEIGTIEIGVGDYITSEDEHMATIPLKLKSEGTSTITITSPEGVSESVKVTVDKAPEVKKSIAVFTTEKSLSVNTGDSMWLAFGLMNEDTGLVEEDWRKMAITVNDPTIISLSDYEETEYGYSLEVIGKKEGVTNVTITDTETGINTIIVISVYDSFVQTYSYAIDDMKVFYPNNQWEDHIATNIYNLNGIYVNNYQCIKNGDTYNIDFDVYNSRYYAGSVDIYDESGMWLGYEEINKYSDITSLWDTGEQAFYLISNTIALIPGGNESNLLTYEQESFSKHTHISLQIPEGGYFTISNNVGTSPGTFFINAFEILFDGAYAALDLVTSDSVKTTALSGFKKSAAKSLAARLIEARNEGLKNELKKKAQKVMLGTMQSEITKITKKFTQAELKDQLVSTDETCSEMANLAENILSSYNISWKHLFQTATGVGESSFTSLSGPAGVALKGCFAITKSTNKLLMATQMATSTQKPYVTVYSKIQEGYINPYGVIVNTAGNMDAEAVLQVFRVSNDDAVDVILDSNNPLEKHELYNICFVKDDQLVQPSGKVTVHIPIPEGMDSNTCKVYRQESNGAWTVLDAHIKGNYLVFETDHFSLYSVIGNMDNLSVHSLPNKVVYTDGDILDTTGLVLDLNGELISEGFVCEPTVLSGVGNLKVIVRYGNATTDFDVRVKALGGYMISGNIESFGDQEENCNLRLIDESGAIENLATSSGIYTFENIAVGTYTLEVSKSDHVTRTYEIVVTDENIVQDVKIHLLGDVTGDGKVNTIDVNRVYAHVRETNLLTGYELECANVAGSGSTVNTIDVNRIYAHVKETNLLW